MSQLTESLVTRNGSTPTGKRPRARKQQAPAASAPTRTVQLIADDDGQGERIAITQKGKTTVYWLDRLPHDYGEAAYRLEKVGTGAAENPVYDVLLDRGMSTCSCPDWTYRGFAKGTCKHILACHALRQAGKL